MRLLVSLASLIPLTAAAQEHVLERQLPETRLSIEIHNDVDRQTASDLAEWVRASAESVTLAYGRFPAASVKVVLQPNRRWFWEGGDAVSFGRVTRNGGAKVDLYIDPDRPMDEFYADWTATHEFSHLMLPLLDREHRWLSEGFATYYQNVLMARAGRYEPDDAWRRLTEGFSRGQASRPELSPNAAAENGFRDARMKYYWAGAALALMADVRLRERSAGRESLDTVLGQLQRCCLPARNRWSATRLLRRLDGFLDDPVFIPLWETYADRPGFPAFAEALNDERYRSIRSAIMSVPADLTKAR